MDGSELLERVRGKATRVGGWVREAMYTTHGRLARALLVALITAWLAPAEGNELASAECEWVTVLLTRALEIALVSGASKLRARLRGGEGEPQPPS